MLAICRFAVGNVLAATSIFIFSLQSIASIPLHVALFIGVTSSKTVRTT